MTMTVQELREILDLMDGEAEIIIHDDNTNYYEIQRVGLNPYYDNLVDNDKIPFCITIK